MGLFSRITRHPGAVLGSVAGMGYGTLAGAGYDYLHGRGGQGNDPEAQRRAMANRAGAYSAEQIGLEHQTQAEQQRREGALVDLDRAYANPERTAGMERLYSANLGNQVAGLQQGFQQASQHAGLAAARRGRLGSSFDTEQQAGLQHGLQSDVMGAENEAYSGLQNLRQNDEQQHQVLRRALLSGDPQTADALQAQAQGIGLQTGQLFTQQQRDEEARRRGQQQMQQNYATLGNVLSSAGAGVQNYYQGY